MAQDIEKLLADIRQVGLKIRQLREKCGANSCVADLNQRQLFILERLAKGAEELSATKIRQHFPGTAPSTVTADLKTLQDRGWVEKRFSREDQRVHFLVLTDEGKQVARENLEYQESVYGPLRRAIKRSAAGLDALMDLMSKANEELDKELASPGER